MFKSFFSCKIFSNLENPRFFLCFSMFSLRTCSQLKKKMGAKRPKSIVYWKLIWHWKVGIVASFTCSSISTFKACILDKIVTVAYFHVWWMFMYVFYKAIKGFPKPLIMILFINKAFEVVEIIFNIFNYLFYIICIYHRNLSTIIEWESHFYQERKFWKNSIWYIRTFENTLYSTSNCWNFEFVLAK